MDDLDAFIAGIEQSAPKDETIQDKHLCDDCNCPLEEVDDEFICPQCNTRANILQTQGTEVHGDESGIMAVMNAQRVRTVKRLRKNPIEYGWAWSTDEAVVHILNQQITALEQLGLVPDTFRQAVKSMWIKYWIQFVAPQIRDAYHEGDYIRMTDSNTLKSRDIEVLIKVNDKVLIPKRQERPTETRKNTYKMMNTRFRKIFPDDVQHFENESHIGPSRNKRPTQYKNNPIEVEISSSDDDDTAIEDLIDCQPKKTRHLGQQTITILTLDRTLCFIEATARTINTERTIFASDLVRCCNQRLIPFFDAHKLLPENFKTNHMDILSFRKLRPPSPDQISGAASLLLRKVYAEQMPFSIPVPNKSQILERLISDLNLPYSLLEVMNEKIDFSYIPHTQPRVIRKSRINRIPQYNRWAFAMFLSVFKNLFGLDEASVEMQEVARKLHSVDNAGTAFSLKDWLKQLGIRYNLIIGYDPYVLLHPVGEAKHMELTPQLVNYISAIVDDKIRATTRYTAVLRKNDPSFRADLTDFLKEQIPKPSTSRKIWQDELHLERPVDILHPLRDSLDRTKRFWMNDIDGELQTLVSRDFSRDTVVYPDKPTRWSLLDRGERRPSYNLDMKPTWPQNFRTLVLVGAFLCQIEPAVLLKEVLISDEYLFPRSAPYLSRTRGRKRTNDCCDD